MHHSSTFITFILGYKKWKNIGIEKIGSISTYKELLRQSLKEVTLVLKWYICHVTFSREKILAEKKTGRLGGYIK